MTLPVYINPPRSEWDNLAKRTATDEGNIALKVEDILRRVRTDGDLALLELTAEIEGRNPADNLSGNAGENFSGNATENPDGTDWLQVSAKEFAEATDKTPQKLKDAIATAARNIRLFHEAQRPAEVKVETTPGVKCLQKAVPIQRVGLYVPGGTAPLFSTVLMLAIPAEVAGCPEIILCTPADRNGNINPAILYAAQFCGVSKVFKIGGAQAIAAMAYGTPTIPKVDKIFGPGNRYVTRAKQMVSVADCAIDMPAGPSEVLVLADKTAVPAFAAADMLSQAEHGADSQALLVCADQEFADKTAQELQAALATLPRRDITEQALKNSRIIVLPERADQIAFANLYAAEHLIVQLSDPWDAANRITAAGSVFIGNYSPESAGDYASGTNHTLPTSGWARSHSGVNLDSFLRKITFQQLTREGLQSLATTITTMATAEGLDAHAGAVKIRIQ